MKLKFIIIFTLCVISFYTYADKGYQLSETPRPLTSDEKSMVISATKKFLSNYYKEAPLDSLQFIWPDYNGNKYGAYCGLVNIQNTQGQYQGFNAFILFFQKNTQGQTTIYYVTTAKAYDIETKSAYDFINICKQNENLQYDLEPLLPQQVQ